MAKTESTAVNDLIALVKQPPVMPSPAEDLQFDARQRPPQAARAVMSASMAPSSAAVAPLPRSRAPHGTSSNLVPPRRSTALPPPRPSAHMAVPKVSAIHAVAPVAPPPFVRTAWPMEPSPSQVTEPIEPVELSLELDDVLDDEIHSDVEVHEDLEAIAFDDDEIAFDGDPNAPVPTSVMAQSEIDRLADQSSRAVVQDVVARVNEGWTPNLAAPLTLDESDSDFGSSETSPFVHEQKQSRPIIATEIEALPTPAAPDHEHRAASAPMIALAQLPRPRATSPMPVTARPTAAHPTAPAIAVAPQSAHLDPAALPQLPRASAMSWPTDFGPTLAPSLPIAAKAIQAPAEIVKPNIRARANPPKKIVAMLPIVGGLAMIGLFAGGYLYFNNQRAIQPESPTAATSTNAPTANAVALDVATPAAATPNATAVPAAAATPTTSVPAAEQAVAVDNPTVGESTNPPVAEPAMAAIGPSAAAEPTPIAAEPAAIVPSIAVTTPTPLPNAAEIALPVAATASLVTVRFESKPSGATVTLVDRGRTSLIGTTPINAALDASHNYEIVFSLDGRATKITTLDPQKSRTVTTVLPAAHSVGSTSSNKAVAAVAAVSAKKPVVNGTSQLHTTATPTTSGRPSDTNQISAAVSPASEVGPGIVMVSSKPPCEILVDGKATGLMTPQRNLTMTAGAHTITLLNKPNAIKKVISVQVSAGKSTKLVQDYTALIKK